MYDETVTTPRRNRQLRRATVIAVVAVLLLPVAAWAGHRFTDVPTSDPFHADITWLADSGVTRGCNPPANTAFCPDDTVTREQMAAFLHRLETEDVFVTPEEASASYVAQDDLDGLLPIATFLAYDDGTVASSSSRAPIDGAITVEAESTGSYFVTLPGFSYGLASSRAVCTPNGAFDVTLQVRSLSGRMWVKTYDSSDGTAADSGFTCAVYG